MLLQAKDVRSNAGAKVTIGKKDYYIAPKLPTRSIALEEFFFEKQKNFFSNIAPASAKAKNFHLAAVISIKINQHMNGS